MEKIYVVDAIRTPGTKRAKGGFKDTRADDLISFILKEITKRNKKINLTDIDDVTISCAFPEGNQGMNIGRVACQLAGFPNSIPGFTINRFCASGLEAIAIAAFKMKAGALNIAIAGGVESMTSVPMGGNTIRPNPESSASMPEIYISMGITAENVAKRYDVSRKDQDEFAFFSNQKAVNAKKKGLFKEIVPTPAVKYTLQENGTYKKESFTIEQDDGIRENTTIEGLAKLRTVFLANGSVTAGNSSQMTDGAAAAFLVTETKCKELGLTPIAEFIDYIAVGCAPDEMGVGPSVAIPALLKKNKLEVKDIDLFELNEAFASQAIYCQRKVGIDMDKINIHGGAIALGHPLGCTGAKLFSTLITNLKEIKKELGIISMCIGGGMGAAGLIKKL